ncbi:MAG: DUF6702 family protein [Calditrichia bacterium]
MSICDIEFNSETSTLEITLKLFTDDLENTLQQGKNKLHLGEEGESATADSLLESYLKRVFAIQVNSKPTDCTFIGKEYEDDVTFCYLEITTEVMPKQLTIDNRVLMKEIPSQVNLVHIRSGENKKSVLLRDGQSEKSVSFE